MGKIIRNLVEYNGIDDCFFSSNHFHQINVDYMFCIPKEKPNIEQIIKVWVKHCILSTEIFDTPKGISIEGQIMTGKKLSVTGDIEIKIQYAACNLSQTVHTAHSTFPFSSYIVLPDTFNTNSSLSTSILIEDILSEQIDLRCIYNNITMTIVAYVC